MTPLKRYFSFVYYKNLHNIFVIIKGFVFSFRIWFSRRVYEICSNISTNIFTKKTTVYFLPFIYFSNKKISKFVQKKFFTFVDILFSCVRSCPHIASMKMEKPPPHNVNRLLMFCLRSMEWDEMKPTNAQRIICELLGSVRTILWCHSNTGELNCGNALFPINSDTLHTTSTTNGLTCVIDVCNCPMNSFICYANWERIICLLS